MKMVVIRSEEYGYYIYRHPENGWWYRKYDNGDEICLGRDFDLNWVDEGSKVIQIETENN